MPFSKPRPVATVDVKLVENIKVKVNNDSVHKDAYASILKNKEKHTADGDEYRKSAVAFSNNKEKNNDAVPTSPKYLIQNGTLIGNAMIATPATPDFDAFPATLKNYGKTGWTGPLRLNKKNGVGWIDGIDWDASTDEKFYTAENRKGNTKGTGIGGGTTATSNVWIPSSDKSGKRGAFSEDGNGILLSNMHLENPVSTIGSEFELQKNQPFSFEFDVHDFNAQHKNAMKALAKDKGKNKDKGKDGKTLEKSIVPNVKIVWGANNYVLTYYRDGRVTLDANGKQFDNEHTLSALIAKDFKQRQLTIYPLGSYIYVYAGAPSTEATIAKNYIGFNVGEALQIPKGPITLIFNTTYGSFTFAPVIHAKSAFVLTPPFSGGFRPDEKIVQTVHLGKFGVGTRESPIVLPDKGDKDQLYGYLKDYPITYSVEDGPEENVFMTTLRLVVPGDADGMNDTDELLQDTLNGIKENWNDLTQQVEDGSITGDEANNAASEFIGDSFDSLVNQFENEFKEAFDKLHTKGSPTTYVNGARVDLTEAASDYFTQAAYTGDFGTGATPTGTSNTLDRVSNDWKNDVLEGILRQVGENYYSAAIFLSTTILTKGLEEVALAPDPQIENSDVIGVTVNQAVEQNKATVTLNNRFGCTEDEDYGRYTYVPGGNNFTGIKPIQIKLGYKDEKGANELDTAFTGYVINRTYSRSSPGSMSTCTLQCEDMSKKAREQFAVNLPFYDGWCLAGDSKILTTKGLITIKDLYESGEPFEVITSYEDRSQAVVKNCIATCSGQKEVYKITLRNGLELKSTLDHKFLKFNKDKPAYACSFNNAVWSKLEELSVGDKIKVNCGLGRDFVYDQQGYSIDELFGWMVGDGYYNLDDDCNKRAMGIVFGPEDKQAFEYLYPIWNNFIGRESKPCVDKNGVTTCSSSHKNVAGILNKKGFKTATARVKELPEYIWTASTQQQCAFLRGLFSADGTVCGGHKKNVRVSLATSSKQLALDVQSLLLSLGITSNIIHKPYSNYKVQKDRVNPRKDGYSVDLCGESSIKYMKHVGFLLDRKTNKWEAPQVPGRQKDFQEIINIEKVEVEDVYDISMPEVHAFYANGIYAHNCHLAVIYHLAKQAGYDDDEILLYQDPRTGAKERIRDQLIGDPDTFTGGCFDGHVSEDPGGAAGLPGAYLHMTLPLAALGVEEPNYNFSFGTPLWACMMRIREFSQFYLFANNFGNIIYGPPPTTVVDTGFEFKEVDTDREYNEFQRNLNVNYDTADTRNAVFLQGITFLPDKNKPGGGNWGTHVHVKRKPNFPNDIGDPSYAPYLRYAFLRNPKWEYPNLAAFAAAEIFRRATRNKFVSDYGAWGQPQLFPYDVVLLNEELANETGIHNKRCIIAAHTIKADTDKMQLNSDFSVEWLDQAAIVYDSNLPLAIRE